MVEQENKTLGPQRSKGYGTRHILAFLGFWGLTMNYAMRCNISIAIVSMVKSDTNRTILAFNPPNNSSEHYTIFQNNSQIVQDISMEACPSLWHEDHIISENSAEGEFHWTPVEQGIILGSFFWGISLTQLPGGIISHSYGGKWPLGIGQLLSGVATIFTPAAARANIYVLCFMRFLCGLGEGFTFPAMHGLIANWAPTEEKSQLCSFIYSGAQFGTAATMIISGYLIDGNVFGGWPSIFYVSGGLTVLWFIFWCFLVFEKPEDHPRISLEELNYIKNSIGKEASEVKLAIPWKAIFSSMPFWALTVALSGHMWGLYTLLYEMPPYLNSILHFDIKQNSYISALPHVLMWLFSMFYTYIMDTLITKKILSTRTVRKLSQSIAHVGGAIFLIGASYSGCNRMVTVTLLTLCMGINGAVYASCMVNHVDIARNHASTLSGITYTFANLTGFIVPYVVGLLLDETPTLENWQCVFFISAGVYIANVLFYLKFASGEEQSWNNEIQIEDTNHNTCSLKTL